MFEPVINGIIYLQSQSIASLVALFWFVLIFEIPRYAFLYVSVVFFGRQMAVSQKELGALGKVSCIIAGHNEQDAIERCVRCIHEQSSPPDEIIVVSDGSSDRMRNRLNELQRKGKVAKAYSTDLRAGKAAAANLAERFAVGDIIINIDCDCSLDRHAFKNILQPFTDPAIGAVSGNILPRNTRLGLIPTFQAIEYLISISLGKQAAAQIDQVTCVSGGFGAFRKQALNDVGGLDAGGGEDLDVTIRLRGAGWKINFAPEALCYTEVPDTLVSLTKQRFRWERDAFRLRYRKHLGLMNPFSAEFKSAELLHELEFLIFNVLAAAAMPFYIIWLFVTYGALAPVILLGVQAGMALLDVTIFLLAAYSMPKARALRLLPHVIGYSVFSSFLMRFIRLAAYVQEWAFDASYGDAYVPEKVHAARGVL